MRKFKVYLDTSVISYLHQPDSPEKQAETLALWERFRRGEYDVYLSQVTLDEMRKCGEEKLSALEEYMSQIDYTLLEDSVLISETARIFIDKGYLTQKSLNDCYHIAYAMCNGCDIILSWNFKHMVNVRIVDGVRIVSGVTGLSEVKIYSPEIITKGGEEND